MSVTSVTFKNKEFTAVPNAKLFNDDKTPKSALDHYTTFADQSQGVYRVLDVTAKTAKAVSLSFAHAGDVGNAAYAGELSDKVKGGISFLAIPRLPDVTRKAYQAFTDFTKAFTFRNVVQKINNVFDAISTWGYFLLLAGPGKCVAQVADAAGLVASSADLSMCVQDLTNARALEAAVASENGDAGLVETARATRIHTTMKVVKAALAVFTGTLGILAIALCPVAGVALGLGASLFAGAVYFYKETATHKMFDLEAVALA